MKEEFKKYLESIGVTESLFKRIDDIYEFYQQICSDEITDIFITEYIKEDGSREYENLWFFSEGYCMEAKQFITKDEFDITPIKDQVRYFKIEKTDYDFQRATEKSRLHLTFSAGFSGFGALQGDIKASKENCDYLKNVILKYIKPYLKGYP